jgi:hypothetical protein
MRDRSLLRIGWDTTRILVASGVLALLISVGFSQEHNPISDADIEALLLSGVVHERLVHLVRERGVSFAPSQAVRTRLRAAGADAELLQVVEQAAEQYAKSRAAVKQSGTLSPPSVIAPPARPQQTSPTHGEEQVEEPKYRSGDYWHFNVKEDSVPRSSRALSGVYEVMYDSERFVIFEGTGANRKSLESHEAEIGLLTAMVGRGRYHGGNYLRFPLFVGKRWSFQYDTVLRGMAQKTAFSAEAEVVGMENLSTAAGTFRVFKIIRTMTAKETSKVTYYYSTESKSIVKMLFEFAGRSSGGTRGVELVAFGSPCSSLNECEKK